MVMLSACRSASGSVSADGVLGLTRAFFYAGAASVVASVWDVPDDLAPDLVADFYGHYRLSGQKDRSLRTAQLRLLAKLRAGGVQISTPAGPVVLREHPALWAGFVLLGEP
jgi:CHAT domain-containing protein